MSTPLRNSDPSNIHLVTLRTHDAALWMAPTRMVEEVLGGVLARYQEIFNVTLYCYSFVSNHYHLLLRAPKGNLDEFEENINREIARRINKINGRRGKFWSRRYDDLIVPTDEDALEAYLYVVTNCTKHGLVKHPREWPGINCFHHFESGSSREYFFTHYSKRDDKGKVKRTRHLLTLSPLPQHSGMGSELRSSSIRKLIQARCETLQKQRGEQGMGFLGASGVRQQRLGSIPREVAHSRRPICYTKNPTVRREFKRQELLRRNRYSDASRQFRLGNLTTSFPDHCHKPPLHRIPRRSPFHPLPLQQIAA